MENIIALTSDYLKTLNNSGSQKLFGFKKKAQFYVAHYYHDKLVETYDPYPSLGTCELYYYEYYEFDDSSDILLTHYIVYNEILRHIFDKIINPNRLTDVRIISYLIELDLKKYDMYYDSAIVEFFKYAEDTIDDALMYAKDEVGADNIKLDII